MDDRQLYETILGLARPWFVVEVEIRPEAEEVLVRLDLKEQRPLACPVCGQECPGYDRAEERRWRHLDTCQYQTVLAARIPRVECPEHGVRQIQVPWAEEKSRFTALFEALAIRLLKQTTVSGLAQVMGLSWDEASGILRRAVARGLERRGREPFRRAGVDETSFQKRHEYVTVVADVQRGRVVWVGDDRRRATLQSYWESLTEAERETLEEVAMDMWEPYIAATQEAIPEAASKIVFDRFHVVQHLNQAVDQVRRTEHRQLRQAGDDRLKGTKYTLLKGQSRRTRKDRLAIRELRASGLKVGRAWAIKEAALKLWEYRSPTWAQKYFRKWYFWATHSRLQPVIRVAKMMKRRLEGILNFLRSQTTNALTEALNSKIQEIKYRARGYRNRENFRLAILFHCGGLQLNPR